MTNRKEYMLVYQRNWMRKRRYEFFKDKKCVLCGSTEKLELDHIEPSTKVTHCVWSWRKELREEELKKCQVLCKKCHLLKTIEYLKTLTGKPSPFRKLNNEQLNEMKKFRNQGYTHRELSKKYKISSVGIHRILTGKSYKV